MTGDSSASDASARKATQAQRIARAAAGVLFFVGLGLVGWWFLGTATKVVAVNPGSRLLGVSRGTLSWLGRTCSVWQAQLEGVHAVEPLEPLLPLGECPPDDPRFDGPVVYQLSGQGDVTRVVARNVGGHQRSIMLQRNLAYALALDGRFLYVGNCAQRDNCQIERLPAENDPGDPLLMQAGILALANMDVDQKELFWIDRGRRKRDCYREIPGPDGRPGELHCHDPVPPRLMAASKNEPRATERVVVSDFDGRRPLLGAAHVYWLGASGVHRVAKAGGAHQLVLPTSTLSGFAADGDEVFFAADAGIFRARAGGEPRLFQRTPRPPRGVAVDAGHIYWIDGDDNAVVQRRR